MKLQEAKQLTESVNFDRIDFAKFDVQDLIKALKNNGFNILSQDYEYAEGNDAFRYLGYLKPDKEHVFAIMTEDDEKPHHFLISHVFVWLGKEGKLYADFSGTPEFEGDEASCFKYLKQMKEL